jgi:predicted PurR-regulated permease PerM
VLFRDPSARLLQRRRPTMAGNGAAGGDGVAGAAAAPRRVRVQHLTTVAGWAAGLFLFFYLFPAFEIVFLSLLASGILASALLPLAQRFPARRWPSAVVVGLLLILLVAGIFTGFGWFVWDVAQEQTRRLPELERTIDELLARWSTGLGLAEPLRLAALRERFLGALTRGGGGGGGGQVLKAAGAIASGLVSVILVLFGTMFLLGERERFLVGPVLRLLPERRCRQVTAALQDLPKKLRWWLIGTLVSMAVTGLASGIGFAIIGLPFAVPLGILAGVSELAPTFGPTFAFFIATLTAAASGGGMVVKVLLVWAVVQTLESYVIMPLVMKRAVSMPPLVTLFSVVFWGKVFGVAGLLLAIPLDLVLWTFAVHLLGDETRAAPAVAAGGPPADAPAAATESPAAQR